MTARLWVGCCLAGPALAGSPMAAPQVFRAGVDAVSVPVLVREDNVPVAGLEVDHFELIDNGVKQSISVLSTGTLPIDVTIVLDTSASVDGDMLARLTEDAHAAAALRPQDRLRVLTFGTAVREVVPLQPVETIPRGIRISAAGLTAFFHGVIAGMFGETEPGRPHVVIALSDGGDNVSLVGATAIRDLARRSRTVLHVILPGVRALDRPPNAGATGWVPFVWPGDLRRLRDAAELTGGRMHHPPADQPSSAMIREVLAAFRAGYVLWYTPAGVDTDGWHEIAVRVPGRRYDVTARRGYER